MKDEIKEIYLCSLEWTKTHDNMGGVMGNVVFKDNMSYETYQKLLKSIYFVLCDKDYITNLQTIEQQYSAILSENAELENKITNLQEELAFIKNDYKKVVSSNDDNIVTIHKALDKLYCYGEVFDSKILQQFQKEMENILKESDKDE